MEPRNLAIVTVFWVLSAHAAAAIEPNRTELNESHRWAAANFAGDSQTPWGPFFSFSYDGKPSSELLKTWQFRRTSRNLDENRIEYSLAWSDPKTKLAVRCVGIEYRDFPNVEWTLYFKNLGDTDSPMLTDIQAIDVQLGRKPATGSDEGEFLLHHSDGSRTLSSDYQPRATVLGPGAEKRVGAIGGRSTGGDFAYFNLALSGKEGLIVAIGWPGQWAGQFVRDHADHLQVRMGQELIRCKLLPGEEIRTPLIALQFWNGGDWLRAQNVWRRWFIAHNLRRPGGKLPPQQWCGAATIGGGLMEGVTEENSKQYIDAYLEMGLKPDFWWMDAGWYPCGGSWPNTGTWEVDIRYLPVASVLRGDLDVE